MKIERGTLLVLIVLFFYTGKTYCQFIPYNGKELYLNGPNVAWNNYGWDFGDNPHGWGGGNGYNSTWWENHFTQLENYGANSARIWVHCKGESNPLFDASNNCTGLNANFLSNLDDLLTRAKNHHLMVLLCLWDFLLVDYQTREQVVIDSNKTRLYINNALIPMVKHLKGQCNLIGFEIINEPEWIMNGVPGAGNHGGAPVSISQMQQFVAMCADAVHANSAKYVTVGSASLKWNASITPAIKNYWSDTELQARYASDKAYLDFYEIHYYDWMGTGNSPYYRSVSYWNLTKPVLIGESGNTGYYTYQQQFDLGYSNNFAGTMIWASGNSGGAASWTDFNTQMKNFRDNHTSVVDFDCATLPVQLVDFSIMDSAKIVKIRWSVKNETDHDHYFIQRKQTSTPTDLTEVQLDSTDGMGVKYYSLNDTLATDGTYNYRLVQVDQSATPHYFLWQRIVVQTIVSSAAEPIVMQGDVYRKIIQSGNYDFSIVDLQGRKMAGSKCSGEEYKIVLENIVMSTGVYFVELRSQGLIYREKYFYIQK